MEIFNNLVHGFTLILSLNYLLVILAGVCLGIVVGALPGLSPSIGVALLVPFTYGMHPLTALVLLTSVYLSSNYGGSITAIAINTPGTAGAVATTFDGYELTKQGKPGLALGTSIVASTYGGILGTIILVIFSIPLAKMALSFGPAEYFSLAVFGLTIVSSLSGNNWLKGFLATLTGLLLTTIGMDPFTGYLRFTFNIPNLADGFAFIPSLIGIFALGEVFIGIEQLGKESVRKMQTFSGALPSIKQLVGLNGVMFKSGLIGTIVGVIPGAGATIATFIAYNEAKRTSKTPDAFGKGCLEGVAAPEAANNGSVGGALVPLLTLGLPGSASTAVLIGALMLHGLAPGPELFKENAEIVYGLFASLMVANIIMLGVSLVGNKLWVKIISAPKELIYPVILAISVIGSYSVNNSLFDVAACLGFGIFAWQLKRNDFPVAPVVLGLILGKMAETNFRRALLMDSGSIFFKRPVSAVILILACISFLWPFVKKLINDSKV